MFKCSFCAFLISLLLYLRTVELAKFLPMEIDFETKVSCCLQNSSGLIDIENSFFAKYVDVFNLQTILLYLGLKNSKAVMKENIPVAVSVSVQ